MSRLVLTGMLVLGLAACSNVAAREVVRDVPRDDGVGTLVAGTLIEATIQGSHGWRRHPLGERLTATVSADVRNARQGVVIPAGSVVALRVAHWRRPNTASQADARITLETLSVTVRRRWYAMRAMVELTPMPIRRPSGEVAVVASGTRILFVLAEKFTAAKRLGGVP